MLMKLTEGGKNSKKDIKKDWMERVTDRTLEKLEKV